MISNNSHRPDLDAIARNLVYLDLDHLSAEEAVGYEYELAVLTDLNNALEAITVALKATNSSLFWPRLHSLLSDTAALLSSRTAPLLAINAERRFETFERPARQCFTEHQTPETIQQIG